MVKSADIHSSAIPIRVVEGRICSPASPAIRKPIAISWIVVFHFASLVTGTLTRNAARYSLRPETRISRHRITMAAHRVQPWIELSAEGGLLVPDSRIVAIEVIGHPRGDKDGQRHPAQPQRAVQDGLGEN